MTNALGNLISLGEGGYNSYNRGTSHHRILPATHEIDFSKMTLAELMRRQGLAKDDPDRVFAVGKYQVIPSTMKEMVSRLKLDDGNCFTPELQERMFSDHLIKLKRPDIYRYIIGDAGASLYKAQKATSQEWASVEDPDTPGRPAQRYYEAGNRSTTRASQVATALNTMRVEYLAELERGLTPRGAWMAVTGQSIVSPEIQIASSDIKNSLPSAQRLHSTPLPAKAVSHTAGESVLHLQQALAVLGYHGTHNHHLVVDGHFGHNTRHAVMAFQQAHHLHVDGVVGKQTLAALEHARHSPLLSEATHPQHALYAQALHGVRRLPEAMFGSARAQHNAAATLTVAAHASGLHRIDHVVLGTDAVRLFAVQGRMDDPAHRRAHVDRMQAVTQTIEHATLAMQKSTMAPGHAHAHAFVAAQAGITHRDVTPGMP